MLELPTDSNLSDRATPPHRSRAVAVENHAAVWIAFAMKLAVPVTLVAIASAPATAPANPRLPTQHRARAAVVENHAAAWIAFAMKLVVPVTLAAIASAPETAAKLVVAKNSSSNLADALRI